jgi:hypothetical protein
MDYLAWALIAAFVTALFSGLLATVEVSRFYRRLRAQHLGLWNSLGGPSPIIAPWQRGMIAPSARFVMQRKYLEVPDDELRALGDRARRWQLIASWSVGSTIGLALLFAATSK